MTPTGVMFRLHRAADFHETRDVMLVLWELPPAMPRDEQWAINARWLLRPDSGLLKTFSSYLNSSRGPAGHDENDINKMRNKYNISSNNNSDIFS